MPYSDDTSEAIAARGEEIYQQQIRDKVDPKHKGKFLVLDIETGNYEIDAEDLVATNRLLAKHPNATITVCELDFQPPMVSGLTLEGMSI